MPVWVGRRSWCLLILIGCTAWCSALQTRVRLCIWWQSLCPLTPQSIPLPLASPLNPSAPCLPNQPADTLPLASPPPPTHTTHVCPRARPWTAMTLTCCASVRTLRASARSGCWPGSIPERAWPVRRAGQGRSGGGGTTLLGRPAATAAGGAAAAGAACVSLVGCRVWLCCVPVPLSLTRACH